MTTMNVKIKKLYEDAIIPKYQTEGSVGMDLHAYIKEDEEPITLRVGKVSVINTGLAIKVPEGYEATVRSRSGLASKGIFVVNSPGTIDSDYVGELKVLMSCLEITGHSYIRNGDRIAQLVFSPISRALLWEVEKLENTERGTGGLGSTGI